MESLAVYDSNIMWRNWAIAKEIVWTLKYTDEYIGIF
jgi:hypothetical protein